MRLISIDGVNRIDRNIRIYEVNVIDGVSRTDGVNKIANNLCSTHLLNICGYYCIYKFS